MKFIIDAQLPYSISLMLFEMGYDSMHTSQLVLKNNTPDSKIIEFAKKENRVVMTKDADFLHSHLLHHQPEKLILIKTGNIKNSILKRIIADQISDIVQLLESSNLIEIHRNAIIQHK